VVPQETPAGSHRQNYETEETAGGPKPRRTHYHRTTAGGLGVRAVQETGTEQNRSERPAEFNLRRRPWRQEREWIDSRDAPDGGHQGRPLVREVRGLHNALAPRPAPQLQGCSKLRSPSERQKKAIGGTYADYGAIPRRRGGPTEARRQRTDATATWSTELVRQIPAPTWRAAGAHATDGQACGHRCSSRWRRR
jgi:hypothetical protein